MTLYQRYTRLPIRFSELGLERGSQKSSYFCTPKSARVIGWAGVDGIHFCFVPKYGDMVFAVNPMAAGEHVQAVSRSFEDFLRLVLACEGSAAIEQARCWTREQFEAFLVSERNDYPPRLDALRAVAGLGVEPMDDPYGYLETLRREFDAAPLQPEEVLLMPEESGPFPVVWNGSLHGRPRLRRPAQEVPVDAVFSWGAEEWRVPYLYLCGEGVVVDFCVGVEPARVRQFLRYYEELCGSGVEPTEEQQDDLERHNPLHIAFHSALTVDGEKLPAKHGSSTYWVPESCGSEELTTENRRTGAIVERYGLDKEKAWIFWRSDYPWRGKSGVKQASLHLSRDKINITAAHFTDPVAGEEIPFVHPVSGERHVLRVLEVEAQTLPARLARNDPETEYPDRFVVLAAAVEPPLESLSLQDCAPADPPRGGRGCCAFQIFAGKKERVAGEKPAVIASSSPHFQPAEHITWRIVVQERPVEDVEIELL